RTAEKLGAELVASYFLPDHQEMGGKEFRSFIRLCKKQGAHTILCTEKDLCKFQHPEEIEIPVAAVRRGLKVRTNKEALDQLLGSIGNK
ncbi:MAG: tetraacyldisaccharide 4'-kinase, partial [Chlamydiales bacterium]